MAKSFIILIVILLISSVYALDCQYTQNNTNYEKGYYFIVDGDYLDYPALEVKNFQQSSKVGDRYITYSTSPASFDVYNNYNEPIETEISFIVDGSEQKEILTIDPKGFVSIKRDYPYSIDNSSTMFDILSPSNLEYKFESKPFMIEVCKMCGITHCFNDNSLCTLDSECGSGICNIAGYCGNTKIVSCEPYGKLNCNNQSCLMPSIKEFGEAYSCDFECKSGIGEDGICLKSLEQLKADKDSRIKNWIYWILIVMIVVTTIYFFFVRKTLVKRIRELNNQIQILVKEISKKEIYIREMEKKGENLDKIILEKENLMKLKEDELDKIDTQLKILKDQINNHKGIAREKFENEYNRLKIIYCSKLDSLSKLKEGVKTSNKELKRFNIERNKLLENERELTKREIDTALEKYGVEYGRNRIEYDSASGYIVFKNSNGKSKPIHRDKYVNRYGMGEGYEVHHIDKYKLNNDYSNLIALTKEEHKKISHSKIGYKNWEEGIKELINAIPGIEKRFNNEIKEKLKKSKL